MSSAEQKAVTKQRPGDFWDRYLAAGRPNTPIQDLFELALDVDSAIRARVAQNPTAPPQLMLILMNDPEADVRIGLAENPKAPFSILQRLATDEDLHVRFDMADNRHMPEILLRRLMDDDNPYVALRAARTVNTLYPDQPELLFLPVLYANALVTA
jgi:hypothetical protein